MALKKPSDFFSKKPDNNQVEFLGTQNIPEKFDVYKSNIKNIETLNEFTEVFGSLKDNVAKIQELENAIEQLKEEISNSLSKEDLDNAMMSNLLILEDNIKKIQFNLKGINHKDLSAIKEEVEDITNKVYFVFEEELPKYKAFIKSSEISFDKRLSTHQQSVDEKIDNFIGTFDNQIQEKFNILENQLEGVNEQALSNISSDVDKLTELVNQELPKYKKQVVEHSLKTEEKINSVYEELEEYEKGIDEKVEIVQQSLQSLIEQEVPKYQNLLLSAKISNDEKIETLAQELTTRINSLVENTQKLNEDVEEKSVSLENSFKDKVSCLENNILLAKKDLEETSSTYKKLYQAIEAKGLADKIKFEEHQGFIASLSEEIASVYQKIEGIKEEVENNTQQELEVKVEDLQKLFTKKLNLLENDIEYKNTKLKETNATLLDDIFTLKENIDQISFVDINERYNKISKKVSYIEEIFSKFNEQTVLKEGLLDEPPTVSNADPLTPLNKKFVTLDQLQEHYRLFINRIQQQLSTLGGGGETRLEFLDDVDRDSVKIDGRFLKYDAASGKWIGALGGGGGSQTLDDTLGLGNTSSLGMSVGISTFNNVIVGGATTALVVNGDARITGILTIGTASLTLDGQNNIIKIGTGITLSENGSANYSGIITASKFVGDGSLLTNLPGSGNSGYANTAGIATQATRLQNSRTFEITGDIVASAISFDGTANVSLAATIQPNSVALGSDTTGDYVQSVSGTSNQITVTSGTGEGSTPTLSIPNQFTAPQDVTVTRDLQVDRNLNVNGNITIGGTSATLFTTEFKVYDPDIVLGFRTDGSGNDVSTDNTANHGGIAIASTEGTPLISLYDVGVGETNPATYKKFMWFKSGTFSGLGTDSWISNYAIGIGSTQFPSGTRLAAGSVQFTQNDLAVVRNINASGIITASSFSGNASSATYATNAGVSTSVIGGIASVSQLNVSGITTVGFLTSTNIWNAGVTTSSSFVKLGGTSSQFLKADGSVDSGTYLTTTGSGTNLTGIVTSIVAGTNVTISGSTGQVTINASGGGSGTNYWSQTAAGINTLSNVGIGTTNPESKLTVNGAVQIQQDSGSNNRLIFRGQPGSSYRWNIDNYSSSNEFRIFREDDATASNGFAPFSISTTGTLTANKFSGDGSLLTNLPSSSGGGSSQWVTTSVGIHTLSNVGIGTTNPTSRLTVSGNASITGILTADQVYTSNNGNGQNIRIGDDFWLGDVNVADTTRFSGAQDSTRAFVIFGSSDAVALGRTGTGPLYYGGNFNAAGNVTATSFSGSGTNLTGIVTSITAGSGISVNQSTGNVTISGITTQFKSITIDNPGSAEKIPMFFSPTSITFTKIQSVIGISTVGSGVTFSIRYGTDISGSGTEVVTGGISVGSTTTGVETTSFNNATVPNNNFVWITTSAFSGSPTFLHATLVF